MTKQQPPSNEHLLELEDLANVKVELNSVNFVNVELNENGAYDMDVLVGFLKAIIALQTQKLTFNKTWVLRWVAIPIAYLFPKKDREEWLGDLREMHHDLIVEEKYPIWVVNTITLGRTIILVWSAIEVRVLDLLSHITGA